MNIIDESYRVGIMLSKTVEGREYLAKRDVARQCLQDAFGEFGPGYVSEKNSFWAYRVLNDILEYRLTSGEGEQLRFPTREQITKLLADDRWQDAVAYTGDFAERVEKMIEQIQARGSFKEVSGFTMTPKLRNAGVSLETAYQRSGLYDMALMRRIVCDKEYGQQLQQYEARRGQIGGAVSHYAYCREARRLMREMEKEGCPPELMLMSENLYMLKDLMEEAIYESFLGGRITIQPEHIRKYRIKELGRGFGVIALWTEWIPELFEEKDRFIYDVMLDGERRNCAMKQIRYKWQKDGNNRISMYGLLYPKSDVGVFERQ